MNEPEVLISEFSYNEQGLEELQEIDPTTSKGKLVRRYPTVYVVKDKGKARSYSVYVGETNNIVHRTSQHLHDDPKKRDDWKKLSHSRTANMYVIANKHFNKSLTLDIENRLMLYLGSVENVNALYNRRTNSQDQYYPVEEADHIFKQIWNKLHYRDAKLFPAMDLLKDLAIFKASPFHKLTEEQLDAKNLILDRVARAVPHNQLGQLILVEGEAGAGKTVLLSSLFYDLCDPEAKIDARLLVNHDQQLKVYKNVATKLGLGEAKVSKPTIFINSEKEEDKQVDVILVDEGHLLWTQGKQAYKGKNQLRDLQKRAKVVILVFDPNQIVRTQQVLTHSQIAELEDEAKRERNLIKLTHQMRIDASQATVNWIDDFGKGHVINPLPVDDKYEIQIFDSPQKLEAAVKAKNSEDIESHYANGISRIIATFDWKFSSASKPKDDPYWMVRDEEFNWELPWNEQIKPKHRSVNYKKLSWAEQVDTIGEVGSIYTVQGSDLNYAGLIIGPSVGFENGKVVFYPEKHANKDAVQNRTLADGSKKNFAKELIQNELNVLLTRGVHGLYIYAVDKNLRQKLLEVAKERKTFK